MTISMYHISVPVLSERLRAFARVLAKAEANAAERKIDPKVFLNSRLAPDMLTLTRQVQITCDHATAALSRLAGHEFSKLEDKEASFSELQVQIAQVRDYLTKFKPTELEGSEDRTISLTIGGRDVQMKGLNYLLDYSMPNFYFHVTIGYAILRHNGVPLGKNDFHGRE